LLVLSIWNFVSSRIFISELDPLLWASILEDSKLSGVLGASSWVVWIHEKLQLDSLRFVLVSPINLVHLLHLGNKRDGGVIAQIRRQRSGGFGKLTHMLYVERTITIYDCYLF
jgi:hypothetical protein